VLRTFEPLFPNACARARSMPRWRSSETGSNAKRIGAIYPPMSNAVMMYEVVGQGAVIRRAWHKKRSSPAPGDRLARSYCQPCVSPVWDTSLRPANGCLRPAASARPGPCVGLDWLKPKRCCGRQFDWAVKAPRCGPAAGPPVTTIPIIPDLADTPWCDGDGSRPALEAGAMTTISDRPRPRMAMRHAKPRRRLAAFDVQHSRIVSNTSRSPIRRAASIRRPRTSPPPASRCCLSSARPASKQQAVADGGAYLRRTQSRRGVCGTAAGG